MNTATRVARIKKLQGVFYALATLNLNGYLYPKEAYICDGEVYDNIVVGGGSAGVVVAARLAEANFRTLIIEAGGNPGLESKYPGWEYYVKNSYLDWNYTDVSDSCIGKCRKAGGSLLSKVLGGSGNTNFMIYGRGNPRDYYKFCMATNDSSWNWENMIKYFKKAENLHDVKVLKSAYGKYHSNKGKIGVTKENSPICDDYLKGFKQAGKPVVVDNIGAGILGYSSGLYYIFEGVRTEGASAYLPPLKNNRNLQITRNSLATKIIIDENKNAVGVEFVKNGKTIMVKARKEIIVSAGPTKSAQLMLLSGIGPKKELEKMNINVISDLPVGKNLQNVLGVLLGFKTNRPANPEPFNAHKFLGPLIVGYSALKNCSRYPHYETLNYIIDDAEYFLSYCGFILGFKNSICDRLQSLAEKRQMFVTLLNNINPKSSGEIVLNSKNPFDQPKIMYRFYSNSDDLETIVSSIIDFVKIEGTPYFHSLGLEFLRALEKCNKFTFGSRAYWKCYALCMMVPTGRRSGTCSMGSVVDSKLKVMGVNHLRVVDASVFPNSIGSTSYASVVAVAEKAAEMILESY